MNDVLVALSTVLKVAVEWGVLERLPCRIRLLKVPRKPAPFYEPEVYEKVVAAAEASDPSAHLAVLLGGDAGPRLGEILALEWADIDFTRGLLHVQRSDWRGEVNVPKSGKGRIVWMTERLAAVLREHRGVGRGRVVCGADGGPLDRDRLKRLMTKVKEAAGLGNKDGRVHVLRHTFGARLSIEGAPSKAIQDLMGHADLSTTQRYMHLRPQAAQDAIRRLDGPAGGDMLETKKAPALNS